MMRYSLVLAFGLLPAAFAATPQVVSTSPSSGTGYAQTFSFTFSDTAGVADLGVVNVLINNGLNGAKRVLYRAFLFRPVAVLPPGTSSANRQLVIPFNSPVKLVVSSAFFPLADAVGIPLSKTGTAIPILVPSGTQPALITLTVTGASRK